jgi:hypothetical protein
MAYYYSQGVHHLTSMPACLLLLPATNSSLPAGANSDVTMSDLRGPGKHPHPLAVKPETWQEVGASTGLAHWDIRPGPGMLGSQHQQGSAHLPDANSSSSTCVCSVCLRACQAARRLLAVLATSAMTQAKDSSGTAAGAASPLVVMDPWVVLQYLLAGGWAGGWLTALRTAPCLF